MIQQVYDLPNFGPCITVSYLKELKKPDSKFLKVPRGETSPIPRGVRRNFDSLQTFVRLMRTLEAKGKKPCGFTTYALPNLLWMLRILIWADPDLKNEIFA